ncbi:MAG: Hsp20/alpha crystallin family protein, partial [Myxococcaceae bacterium]
EPRTPAEGAVSPETIAQLFANLEAGARSIPSVAQRVPPFSFAPPLDALDEGNELIIEVAVAGVDREDVSVELNGEMLTISGVRDEHTLNGGRIRHAEIARGPFHRMVRLPHQVQGEPRVEVEQGIVRIRLAKAPEAPATSIS